MSKNDFERDYCMGKLKAREVAIFLEKFKSLNILSKMHKTNISLPEVQCLNQVNNFARIQS